MKNRLQNNEEIYINLPAVVNNDAVSNTVDQLNTSFLTEEQQLELALKLIGIEDVDHLFTLIRDFFTKKIPLKRLSLTEARGIDFKRLMYEFLKENGIQRPVFENEGQREMVFDIYFKLGRAYIHNILIPALIKVNPRLAYSTLQELKRIVKSVSIDKGVNPNTMIDKLMLNDIEIPIPQVLIGTGKSVNGFIIPNLLTRPEILSIGKALEENDIIPRHGEFLNILTSGGYDFEPLKIYSRNLKTVAYVFYRLYTPYDENHGRLISMTKGKGYWNFLQQNIFDIETNNTSTNRLKKINSELMKDPNQQHIISLVDSIIKPVYKIHYPKSELL